MAIEYVSLQDAADMIQTTPEVIMSYYDCGVLAGRKKNGELVFADCGPYGLHVVSTLLGIKRIESKFQIGACPFCGSEMHWESGNLECDQCDCRVFVFADSRQVDWPDQDNVIERWNKRVSKTWDPSKSVLRPCPCCGKPAKLSIEDEGTMVVRCSDDKCPPWIEVLFDENDEEEMLKAVLKVIGMWNRRTSDP